MTTINDTLAARRQSDEAALRTEERWIERCFEYLSGLLASLLKDELAGLPSTATRWERKHIDGVIPEYLVTVTIQRNVFGQFLPLVVRARAIRETTSTSTTVDGVLVTTTERRLTVSRLDVLSRRNPPEVIVVNGFAVEADLAAYVDDVTVDFNLRQSLVTPPVADPETGIVPPWPEVDLVELHAVLVATAAGALYAERYPGA